ncbi:SIR2 family protein [Mycetocola zhujimingii]|uniref:SIR2 family protein n=1 Tax=Mycetocola zhujimingii TaxID=2079792 RepID=UPI0013C4B3D5|nr:SIR2 family protein [Mycetocola zhujimingii]
MRDHNRVVEKVAKGYYCFWLGSGISKRRANTVPEFLKSLLEFLVSRLEPEDLGAHRVALSEILSIARIYLDDAHQLEDLLTWTDLESICEALADHYSAALDVDVDGFPADYLLWEGIDVVTQYAGPMEPDIEHVAVAMLGAEGAAPILISANWDPLVERAYDLLFGSRADLLKVEVHPDEFRPPHARTELVKFHGDATLASSEENRYRPLMIARKSQISDWITDHSFRALRERLTGIVRDHPSLIAGLSAQDADIQAVFGSAADMNPWVWPSDAGAVVVASPHLGTDQKQVLRQAYSSTYTPHARDIQEDACLGAYPRVVFLALLVHVWRTKLFVALDGFAITTTVGDAIRAGLNTWALQISSALEADDLTDLLTPIATFSRGIARFRRGQAVKGIYEPLTDGAVLETSNGQMGRPQDRQLTALSLAIGVLAYGAQSGRWKLTSSMLDVSSVELNLTRGVERNVQTFADDGAFAAAMAREDLSGPLTVIVSSSPFQRRSPQHSVGRTGRFIAEPFYLDEVSYTDDSIDAILDSLEGYLVL